MRFKIKCRVCGECIWIHGIVESDVNATVLDDNDTNWGDGCDHLNDGNCEYDIVDEEYIDYAEDYV